MMNGALNSAVYLIKNFIVRSSYQTGPKKIYKI